MLTLPHINEALGRSVIYDEYKGDFSAARSIAEQQLDAARSSAAPSSLADALLARGIVHLFQGEAGAALGCFAEIERIVPGDPARLLRAASYGTLAVQLQLNTFPGGIGASGAEWEARKPELFGSIATFEQQANQLLPSVAESEPRLECWLVRELLSMLPTVRSYFVNLNLHSQQVVQAALPVALQLPTTFRTKTASMRVAQHISAYVDLIEADIYKRAGQLERARALLDRAYASYQQADDRAGYAICLMTYGDWLAAPNSSPVGWNHIIQEGVEDSATSGEAVEFDRSRIDIAGAQEAYLHASQLFLATAARRGTAAIALRLDYLAMLEGNYARAHEHATQARQLFEEIGDWLGANTAVVHQTLCTIGEGRLVEERTAVEAVGIWGRTRGSFSYCLGLGLLCARVGRRWLVRDGDYERALACFHLAEALFTALGTISNAAQCVVDQAITFRQIGESAVALTAYERAQELYVEANSAMPALAASAAQRAVLLGGEIYQLYNRQRDGANMERVATRLQELYRRAVTATEPSERGQMANVLGLAVESQISERDVFIPLYRAFAARDHGDSQTAAEQFAVALAAARQVRGSDGERLVAVVLGHQRRYPEAIAAYKRSLEPGGMFADLQSALRRLPSLATSGWFNSEQRKAQLRHYENAAIMFTRLKGFADAKQCFEQLERLGGSEWWASNSDPWLSLSDYGEMYEGLGDLPRALDFYDHAIRLLEQRRGSLSRSELRTALSGGTGVQYLYFNATRAALRMHIQYREQANSAQGQSMAVRAFDYAERGKARSLLDLMAGSAANVSRSKDTSQHVYEWRQRASQLDLWGGLLAQELGQSTPDQGRIALLRAQITASEVDLRQIEAELALSDPDFYRAINPQTSVVSLNELCALLATDTALLQYLLLGEDVLMWAITHEGMVQAHHTALDTRALTVQIRQFHRLCMDGRPIEQLDIDLASTLLHPLDAALRSHQNVIIVPYAAAHVLPFHALPWENQPLLATHTLSYLPSASMLQFLTANGQHVRVDGVLAVGDPAKMAYRPPLSDISQPQPPLPAAATEAAFVASLFPQSLALIGEQATESAVRQQIQNYPILHFATHGYLSEEAPLLSSILLADGEALTVSELMGLRLDADLVVLSACDTARGQTTSGDDILGLTRGLFAAGARAAVVSLWPVDDLATSLLMSEFYRSLKQGIAPRIALQKAQQYLRTLQTEEIARARVYIAQQLKVVGDVRHVGVSKNAIRTGDYTHPYFWAPFVLIGR